MTTLPWTLTTTSTSAKTTDVTGAWSEANSQLDLYVPSTDPDFAANTALFKVAVTLGYNTAGKTTLSISVYEFDGSVAYTDATTPAIAAGALIGAQTFATSTPTATFLSNANP